MNCLWRLWAVLTGQKIVYLKDFDGEITTSLAYKTPFGWVARRNGRAIVLREDSKIEGVSYVTQWKESEAMRYPEAAKIRELEHDNAELRALFDLQHKRTLEADKLWQKAHNKPDTFPDLGKLIDWLLFLARSCKSCVYGPLVGSSPVCAACKLAFKCESKGKDMWTPKGINKKVNAALSAAERGE